MSTQEPIHRCVEQLYSELPKLGSNQMSFSRWMDQGTSVHTENGLLFNAKRK